MTSTVDIDTRIDAEYLLIDTVIVEDGVVKPFLIPIEYERRLRSATKRLIREVAEEVIGQKEWLADFTMNMTADQVERLDKDLDTIGRIKRNKLRDEQRTKLNKILGKEEL
jgi:hypothetical protein